MPSRGIRNNNPGNIRSSGTDWVGQVSVDDAGFVVFDTPSNGIRAMAKLLVSYQDAHGLRTVRGIVNRWAPPSENDTGTYVNAVADTLGVSPDLPISVHNATTLGKLVAAIIQHENGSIPYTQDQLMDGVDAALGVPVSGTTVPNLDTTEAPEATPPKGSTMWPLLLPGILQMIPQLVGAFSKGGKAEGNQKLAQTVVDVFTAAVPGAVNAQQAVEMATADPAVRAAATTEVLTHPDISALLPVLDHINQYEQGAWAAEDAGRNAAATRALAQQDAGPLYGNPTFLLAVFVMALVGFVVGVVLLKGGFSTDMQAFVIGAVVGSALTAVLGFYFGSSRNSSAKDATIAQLANK